MAIWPPTRMGCLPEPVSAGRAASANGVPTPLRMTAVLTTHAKALTSATPGDFVAGAGDVPVFLVTVRGNFAASAASRLAPAATTPNRSALSAAPSISG